MANRLRISVVICWRRVTAAGRVTLSRRFGIDTSARRNKAMGRVRVFRIYIRNFWSEVLHHRPTDLRHLDVNG